MPFLLSWLGVRGSVLDRLLGGSLIHIVGSFRSPFQGVSLLCDLAYDPGITSHEPPSGALPSSGSVQKSCCRSGILDLKARKLCTKPCHTPLSQSPKDKQASGERSFRHSRVWCEGFRVVGLLGFGLAVWFSPVLPQEPCGDRRVEGLV